MGLARGRGRGFSIRRYLSHDALDHGQQCRQPAHGCHNHGEDDVGYKQQAEHEGDAGQKCSRPSYPKDAKVGISKESGQEELQGSEIAVGLADGEHVEQQAQRVQS